MEAVEKPMSDEDLKSFHQHYISILQQQRQSAQTWTEQQLHQMISHHFNSLQYRNDQPDGSCDAKGNISDRLKCLFSLSQVNWSSRFVKSATIRMNR